MSRSLLARASVKTSLRKAFSVSTASTTACICTGAVMDSSDKLCKSWKTLQTKLGQAVTDTPEFKPYQQRKIRSEPTSCIQYPNSNWFSSLYGRLYLRVLTWNSFDDPRQFKSKSKDTCGKFSPPSCFAITRKGCKLDGQSAADSCNPWTLKCQPALNVDNSNSAWPHRVGHVWFIKVDYLYKAYHELCKGPLSLSSGLEAKSDKMTTNVWNFSATCITWHKTRTANCLPITCCCAKVMHASLPPAFRTRFIYKREASKGVSSLHLHWTPWEYEHIEKILLLDWITRPKLQFSQPELREYLVWTRVKQQKRPKFFLLPCILAQLSLIRIVVSYKGTEFSPCHTGLNVMNIRRNRPREETTILKPCHLQVPPKGHPIHLYPRQHQTNRPATARR